MAPSRGAKRPAKKSNTNAVPKHQPTESDHPAHKTNPIPPNLYQTLLTTLSNTFSHLLANPQTLTPLLQQIKHHLYHRDFAAAFNAPEHLEAYAVRWSAARALAYVEVLHDVLTLHLYSHPETKSGSERGTCRNLKVSCLGGGAGAEVLALAGVHNLLSSRSGFTAEAPLGFDITTVDLANWRPLLSTLHASLTQPAPPNPRSASTKPPSTPVVSADSFTLTPCQADVLTLLSDQQAGDGALEAAGSLRDADVVMVMFTLNELYSMSRAATQTFLLRLTSVVKSRAVLLVVDSPGSYSNVDLKGRSQGSDESEPADNRGRDDVGGKRYPMAWLLDHALLRQAEQAAGERCWEKLVGEGSRWFRLAMEGRDGEGLRYAIPLENTRYQMHLYRRV